MHSIKVAGSLVMDIVARTRRHPRAGETVLGNSLAYYEGGKGANQAIAAARMGVPVYMIGAIGDDGFGKRLLTYIGAQGVDISSVITLPHAPTGTSLITVTDSGENTIVMTPGANNLVSAEHMPTISWAPGDMALAQLEIPTEAIAAFFERAKLHDACTLLNAAPAIPCPATLLDAVDILIVNEPESAFLLGKERLPSMDTADLAQAARELRRRSDQRIVITLGERGSLALSDAKVVRIPARKVAAVDTTGAGDCFTGALAAALIKGVDFEQALHRATNAAAICVQRPGAAPSLPTRAEVEAFDMRPGPDGW